MNNNTLTAEAVKQTDAARELRNHIKSNTSGLVGCQWIVMEFIEVPGKLVGKIIGSNKQGGETSAPIDYFRERLYCGIHYHMEDWCNKPETIASVKRLADLHKNEFAFYNPYQDRVILINK
jgi:hypothetical protein